LDAEIFSGMEHGLSSGTIRAAQRRGPLTNLTVRKGKAGRESKRERSEVGRRLSSFAPCRAAERGGSAQDFVRGDSGGCGPSADQQRHP
jgi:hypothetical protein